MLKSEGYKAGDIPGQAKSPARVVLTGYRATGKSLVGSQLASILGYRFIDTDVELVAQIQCSVAEFVREQGWPAFRKLEQDLLARLVCMNQVVIATGGGMVLHQKEWQDVRKESLVVWLQADARTIRERLRTDPASQSQRPSLSGDGNMEEVETILAERQSSYQKGSDMAIDTTDRSPDEIAALIKQHITIT